MIADAFSARTPESTSTAGGAIPLVAHSATTFHPAKSEMYKSISGKPTHSGIARAIGKRVLKRQEGADDLKNALSDNYSKLTRVDSS